METSPRDDLPILALGGPEEDGSRVVFFYQTLVNAFKSAPREPAQWRSSSWPDQKSFGGLFGSWRQSGKSILLSLASELPPASVPADYYMELCFNALQNAHGLL